MVLDGGNPILVQKFNKSATEQKYEQVGSLTSSQEANPASASQKHIVFKENDGMTMYLRQSSAPHTATPQIKTESEKGRALLAMANGQQPFEMVSDEDLLGSNFDRISKIVPNQDILNEFNVDDSISPQRRGTDPNYTSNEPNNKIIDLLKEISTLQQVIKIKDNTILQL